MDSDIQFGELEEAPRQQRLRPDQNRHFAVVACQTPAAGDLPIYVDIDVLRDVEAHAASNLEAELGGVLLGGQYQDDQGCAFVVISDSLHAEHYEHSKGSFKFTHETWAEITRQRDAFPADLQMVGWYHTHPGWGVFLSGMDTFICGHFFNRSLDVALVVDPCKQERAFFQWTTRGPRRTRLTRGFYLTGSRFRLPELQAYAAQLEGQILMPNDPRYSHLPGVYPPTVVHVGEPKQASLTAAVLGMLTLQFLVVALIAWRTLAPDSGRSPAPAAAQAAASSDLAAQRALLDRVIGQLDAAPDGVVQTLEQERQRNEELQASNLGLLAQVRELASSQEQAAHKLQTLMSKNQELTAAVERLQAERAQARRQASDRQDKWSQYAGATGEEAETEINILAWLARWKWYLGSLLVAALAALAGGYTLLGPRRAANDDIVQPTEEPPAD